MTAQPHSDEPEAVRRLTTQSIRRTYFEDPTLEEFRKFLDSASVMVPGTARMHLSERRGDPRDPREAGHRAVTVEISWRE